MQWFKGSIAEAIAAAKSQNSLFVVYIAGPSSDEASTKTSASLEDAQVSSALISEDAVAIKLENGTEACHQFSQIYPLVLVPSVFFIHALNGIPVEVIGGPLEPQDLLSKIHSAFEKHKQMINGPSTENGPLPTSQPSQETKTATSASSNQSGSSATPVESELTSAGTSASNSQPEQISARTFASSSQSEQISAEAASSVSHAASSLSDDVQATEGDLQMRVDRAKQLLEENCPSAEESKANVEVTSEESISGIEGAVKDDSANENASVVSLEERVDRAKKLLAQKKEERESEDITKEKSKEKERRKMGQQIQKMQRRQEEDEQKKMTEEWRKERAEDKAARERIRQQIAQDRAERAMKWNAEKEAEDRRKKEEQLKKLAEQQAQAAAAAAARSNVANIQFRLPDGSSHTSQFPADVTMAHLRSYVHSNLQLSFRNFTLSTTFPKRVFTDDDAQKDLRELQLAPSAVVLVLPAHSASVVPSGGGSASVMNLIWFLLSPVVYVLNFLKNSIFGTPKGGSNAGQKRRADTNEERESSSSGPTDSRPRTAYKRRTVQQTQFRQEGNIHRLGEHNDNEDENNTWNGNSTQQM